MRMRRSFIAILLLAAGCVDVPDGIRAEFAGPGAADRSNYRPGRHGSAPPVEDPPAPKAAATAVTTEPAADGGVATPPASTDGDVAPVSTGADGGAV
ncbi:MAG: hypothetical protein J0I07_10635 [Myxococcales bacterium]|nr:hypothetical protein [Myxococcales bacterium]